MRRRIARAVALVVVALVVVVATAWGALALYYLVPASEGVRRAAGWTLAALGLALVAALVVGRWRVPSALVFIAGLSVAVVFWTGATPSQSRDWQPEVAVLPSAVIQGDLVTVRNIRNFDYRTETDFVPAYYDRTFDLRRLDHVDLLAAYWMGPAIAHVFVSFGFGADDYLTISIEARKDRVRPYATLPGLFRQYELVYVVADERDAIRVRTNYRKSPPEDVYLFRVNGSPDDARRFFLDYIRAVNALTTRPRFYNTLTTNCTTLIRTHAAVNPGAVPYSWKILLSGYAPEYAYEQGRLDQRLSFPELKRRSHINEAAQAADQAPDFSRRIRAALP